MMEIYLMGFSHGQGKMAFQPPLKCSPQGYFHLHVWNSVHMSITPRLTKKMVLMSWPKLNKKLAIFDLVRSRIRSRLMIEVAFSWGTTSKPADKLSLYCCYECVNLLNQEKNKGLCNQQNICSVKRAVTICRCLRKYFILS